MWLSSSFIDFHIASCSPLPSTCVMRSYFAVRIVAGSSLTWRVPRQFGNMLHP
jgi:hypothetical protein